MCAAALLFAPLTAFAADDQTTLLVKLAQEKLHILGFDPGLINGDSGGQTQAALAQFQLSRTLPASGSLDNETLSALGLVRGVQDAWEASASIGASASTSTPAPAEASASAGASAAKPEPESAVKK